MYFRDYLYVDNSVNESAPDTELPEIKPEFIREEHGRNNGFIEPLN